MKDVTKEEEALLIKLIRTVAGTSIGDRFECSHDDEPIVKSLAEKGYIKVCLVLDENDENLNRSVIDISAKAYSDAVAWIIAIYNNRGYGAGEQDKFQSPKWIRLIISKALAECPADRYSGVPMTIARRILEIANNLTIERCESKADDNVR